MNTYTLAISIPSAVPVVDELGTIVPAFTVTNYSIYCKFIKDRRGLPELNSNQQYVKLYFLSQPPTAFLPYTETLDLTLTNSSNEVLKRLKFQLQSVSTSQFKVVNEILNSVWQGIVTELNEV